MPKDSFDGYLETMKPHPEVVKEQALEAVRQAFRTLRTSTTEEDILQIWREVQVEKVHDS